MEVVKALAKAQGRRDSYRFMLRDSLFQVMSGHGQTFPDLVPHMHIPSKLERGVPENVASVEKR